MDCIICEQCTFGQVTYKGNNFYMGCFHKPNKGKWVDQIKECPKEKREEMQDDRKEESRTLLRSDSERSDRGSGVPAETAGSFRKVPEYNLDDSGAWELQDTEPSDRGRPEDGRNLQIMVGIGTDGWIQKRNH